MEKNISDLILALRQSTEIEIPSVISMDELRQIIAADINKLIQTDFEKLVSILYRMDISEPKLKSLLNQNRGTDAGFIIADMMIERQEQKIKSRQQFSQRDNNISDEERW